MSNNVPVATLFPLTRRNAPKMLRHDLTAAGIACRNEAGVFDWHSFRHGYVTRLALSSLPLKIVQSLSRHSTPVLTLSVYSHVDGAAKGAAIAALPLVGSGEGGFGRTALGTAHTLPDTAKGGNTRQRFGRDAQRKTLDNDAAEVVSCKALGAACPDIAQPGNEEIAGHAGVAEWQTRWIQNPVAARP